MNKILLATLLLATASLCAGLGPVWYTCDPTICTGACVCPSQSPPGGLAVADTPQFVLISHDDAISPLANSVVRAVTDGFKNPNGCNVPATWFAIEAGTDCKLVKQLWDNNHEIATHTISHARLAESLTTMEGEITGAKKFLNSCGVPNEDLRGFRSPYLVHNPKVRALLAKYGFGYDSSITEYVGQAATDTTTNFGTNRLWPYTMDKGIIQNCAWTTPDGNCDVNERYPGMFELPIWDLPADNNNTNFYTMDPDAGFGGDLFTTLQTNFDAAYNGNRAPFPVFVHAPWFTPARTEATIKFIEYALSKPNTYFVTFSQLLNWMKAPVPASQIGAALTCKPVDLKKLEPKPCQVYTVQNGDFLDLIAGKFGIIDSTQITALNAELSSTPNPVLMPGMQLRIPPWNDSCGAGVPAGSDGTAATAPAPPPLPTCRTWTVQTGDFLYKIAETSTASVTEIAKINGLPSTEAGLSIGQVLKVPPYPDCCATNSCPPEVAPPQAAPAPVLAPQAAPAGSDLATNFGNRVEVDFKLSGMSQKAFETEHKSLFASTVASLIKASVDNVKLELGEYSRRRLQQDANNTVTVKAIIVSNDPAATYYSVQNVIENGQLSSTLSTQGLTLATPPIVTAYKDNVVMSLPAQPPATSSSSSSSDSDSGLSTAVIIGIAVGGGVVLIAAIVTTVICLKRRKARNSEQDDAYGRKSNAPSATFSLKKQQQDEFMMSKA